MSIEENKKTVRQNIIEVKDEAMKLASALDEMLANLENVTDMDSFVKFEYECDEVLSAFKHVEVW